MSTWTDHDTLQLLDLLLLVDAVQRAAHRLWQTHDWKREHPQACRAHARRYRKNHRAKVRGYPSRLK